MAAATARNPHDVPRAAPWLIGAALAITVAMVAYVRISGTDIHAAEAPPVAERSLRFEDRPDGSVAVIDAAAGREIERVQGEAGFLRGALRALARERRLRGLGAEAPFTLTAHTDGRLTLADPATGERIALESFGPTNAGVFSRLLTMNR